MVNVQDIFQILLHSGVKHNDDTPQPLPISEVPKRLRAVNPDSFNPMVVSIGPLHYNDENVQAFEGQKAAYMQNLLLRLGSPSKTGQTILFDCVKKVSVSIEKIRNFYDGIDAHNDDELVKMMVMDGCFILEFCHKLSEGNINGLLAKSVVDDLLLVENQIPFFVLDYIFECTPLNPEQKTTLTRDIILPILENGNLFHRPLIDRIIYESAIHDHILGMLHKFYQPQPLPTFASDSRASRFHSAIELDMAGVNFKPNQDASWPMAMKLEWSRPACFLWFWSKPTLKMPVLVIDHSIESRIRNLIAYEQSFSLDRGYVTSYAIAMDMLIDSPQDIRILVESQVIVNRVGSNEEAAKMMNNICKEAAAREFFYFGQSGELDSYYNSYWPKKIALLRRTYFNSPWNIIALLAGIILFLFTLIQTIYATRA